MKLLIIILALVPLWTGCGGGGDVSFEWFNLGTNEIWVTEVIGLPAEASPGRLLPNHAESQLERSESTFSETVRIKDRIKIVWKDGGTRGWPGGLQSGELIPPGPSHETELDRDALGVPGNLSRGRIRFTYLGTNTWRVRQIKGSGWK